MTRPEARAPLSLEELRRKSTIGVWPELASVLHCGRNQAFEAVRRGDVPSLRIGSSIRVPVPALLRLLGDEPTPRTESDGPDATSEPTATTDDTHTEVTRATRPTPESRTSSILRNAGAGEVDLAGALGAGP